MQSQKKLNTHALTQTQKQKKIRGFVKTYLIEPPCAIIIFSPSTNPDTRNETLNQLMLHNLRD